MARSTYLTDSFWRCLGPSFKFVHEECTSLGSCMVVGKVSNARSFLAPYGNFDINNPLAPKMKNAMFQFALIRPDNQHVEFQSDFDASINAIRLIVEHSRDVRTSEPFLSFESVGSTLNFSHQVAKVVRISR